MYFVALGMRCVIVSEAAARRIATSFPKGSVTVTFDGDVLVLDDSSIVRPYRNVAVICVNPNIVDPMTGKTAGRLLDDFLHTGGNTRVEAQSVVFRDPSVPLST